MKRPINITQMTPEKLGLSRYKPDAKVERRFREALAYLVFRWQFFAQIIYSDMELIYTDHPLIAIAGTDSHAIWVNPEGFERAGINDVLEIVFVLAHEVSHRVLYDVVAGMVWAKAGQVPLPDGKFLPYDDEIMGWAMDYRINGMLVHAKLGKMPKVGLYDPQLSKEGKESVIDIYEKIYRKIVRILIPAGGGGFDKHMFPSPHQIQVDKGRREQSILAAAQLSDRAGAGLMPAAMRRVIEDILNPKVPWQQHLRSMMRRKAGDPQKDWSTINRRLAGRPDPLYYPGKGHRGAGIVVCGADNSGSITNHIANVFGSEMAGIVADIRPWQLIVIWCDAAVTRVDELDDPEDLTALFADWKTTGIGGGGGTSFAPVFEKVAEMGIVPDMLVYFTDMAGRFPQEAPPYPVIWASTSKRATAPFGEVIHVEI